MLNPIQPPVAEMIGRVFGFVQAGRGADAEAAARALHQRFPTRGDVNETLSLVLVGLDRKGDALPFAEAAVRAEPKNAGYLINLGRLYLQFELIEEALPVLEKAFRIDPKMYQAPSAMGEFFHQTGNGQRAIHYLKQATAVSPPATKPLIEMLLADCLSSLGRIVEAELLYRDLSNNADQRHLALVNIANLRKHKADSSLFEELQMELDSAVVSPRNLAGLHLAIGRMFENSGEYAKAFEQFKQAKTFLRNEFDLARFTTIVDRNISEFTPDVLRNFEGYGDLSRLPVFVVGLPRSGTTLTEQIIAAHPKAGGVGELNRMSRTLKGLSEDNGPAHLFNRLREGGPERCRDLAGKYVSMLKFLAPGAKRVVDKMPHNFVVIGLIALFYPNARIVHCMRNPADTFISAFQNMMNPAHSYSYAPDDYAHYYRQYLRLMRHWQSLIPDRIFTLRYEDLVSNQEEMTRKLLDFLGLAWDSRCLRFHETGAMVKTFSRQQVRSAVHQGSTGRWQNYRPQLQPLADILKDDFDFATGRLRIQI